MDDGIVKYKLREEPDKKGVYVAAASFITSYARRVTILSAQMLTDNYLQGKSKAEFCYADTDSLHISLNGETPEEFLKNSGLDIDDYKLGAWKYESRFCKAKFLRQKCYIEKQIVSKEEYEKGLNEEYYYLYSKDDKGYYLLNITVAGMPKECYPYVNFNNFKVGASYKGKRLPKNVKGGVVLEDIDFTIKEV